MAQAVGGNTNMSPIAPPSGFDFEDVALKRILTSQKLQRLRGDARASCPQRG